MASTAQDMHESDSDLDSLTSLNLQAPAPQHEKKEFVTNLVAGLSS
jgi:hypothetical protein